MNGNIGIKSNYTKTENLHIMLFEKFENLLNEREGKMLMNFRIAVFVTIPRNIYLFTHFCLIVRRGVLQK